MTDSTDAFVDTRFSTEINNRMRVPDRIMVAGDSQTRSPTFMGVNGPPEPRIRSFSKETFDMKVPDRIIVAGGDRHIGAKSTPYEMQLENSVLPPTRDHVIVVH